MRSGACSVRESLTARTALHCDGHRKTKRSRFERSWEIAVITRDPAFLQDGEARRRDSVDGRHRESGAAPQQETETCARLVGARLVTFPS